MHDACLLVVQSVVDRADQMRFNVNGQDLTLPGSFDLGKNLNSVIKFETGFKARMSFCSVRREVVVVYFYRFGT